MFMLKSKNKNRERESTNKFEVAAVQILDESQEIIEHT